MNNSIQTLIQDLSAKLTGRAKNELARLLSSPEAEAFLAIDSDAIQKQRTAQVKALQKVPAKYAAAKIAAGKACTDAMLLQLDAQKALRKADEHVIATSAAGLVATVGEADELASIESELRETADPRLLTFAANLVDVASTCRHSVAWFPIVTTPDLWGHRESSIVTNAMQVNDLISELNKAAASALMLQLSVLTSTELIEWLQGQIDRLQPALRAFSLDSLLVKLDPSGALVLDKGLNRYQASEAAVIKHGGKVERNETAQAALDKAAMA